MVMIVDEIEEEQVVRTEEADEMKESKQQLWKDRRM